MGEYDEPLVLHLSCLNLPADCAEHGSRIAITLQMESGNFIELGQTETKIGVNPAYENKVAVSFRPHENQILRLILYKVDASTEVIQGKLGESEVCLLTLVSSCDDVALPVYRDMTDFANPHPPVILANVSLPETLNHGTVFNFVGTSMRSSVNDGLLIAPYFILQLVPINGDEHPVLLYRSEVANGCNDPRWKEFSILFGYGCPELHGLILHLELPTRFFPSSSEYSLELLCFNFCNNHPEDILLGRVCTSFYQLLNSTSNKFMLKAETKRKDSPSIELVSIQPSFDLPSSFSGILRLGNQLNFTMAIDFTSNNGGPNEPGSLHFIHPHNLNVYMKAMKTIGNQISKFDRLGRISFLGFGAKIPPRFEFSNLFALNSDLNNPYIKGIDQALQFYRNVAMSALLYAPTEYCEVIHHIIKLAKAAQRTTTNLYFVLIVLTNGSIKNVQDCVDAIVKASYLPISIIFVPLGNPSHPVASANSGDTNNLKKFASPTLKSFNNVPLFRETVSVVSPKVDDRPVTERMFVPFMRQMVLHSHLCPEKS